MAEPYRYTGWLLRKDASARTRDKEGIVFVRTGREAGVLIIAELFSEVVTVSQPVPGEEETDTRNRFFTLKNDAENSTVSPETTVRVITECLRQCPAGGHFRDSAHFLRRGYSV